VKKKFELRAIDLNNMTSGGDLSKINDLHAFTCPLCLEVFENPCKIPCRHSFCTKCLDQFMTRQLTCPVCRQAFDKQQKVVDTQMIDGLRSQCFECEGCRRTVVLHSLRAHMASCEKLKALNDSRIDSTKIKTNPEAVEVPNRQTFKCPYCALDHLDQSGLVDHCLDNHRNSRQAVICPICAAMPWGDPTQVSGNFMAHLTSRHKFEYDTYVDYQQDDDAMLRAAIMASLSDH
jgi:hypothetical protein